MSLATALGLWATVVGGPARACPQVPTEVIGTVSERRLDEISGIVASSKAPGYWWVHNDSGDQARIYRLTPTGELDAIVSLPGVRAFDFEDLAVDRTQGAARLVIADFGDNARRRKTVVLHVFEEPTVDPASKGRPGRVRGLASYRFVYPDGPRDAEAIMVDPRDGEVVVITKHQLRAPEVFSAGPIGALPSSSGDSGAARAPAVLTKVGEVSHPRAGHFVRLVTAADVSPTGDTVVVRTYEGMYVFRRSPEQHLSEALLGGACRIPGPDERQGEAIAFTPQGDGIVTISEGVPAALHRRSLRE